MALRKEEEQQETTMKRSRITSDISPELRRRIKIAASQRDVSISEYLGQILEEHVPEEMNLVEQDVHLVPPDILEEMSGIREKVIRESKGHIFEDSTEVLRQQREERIQYLEELREQPWIMMSLLLMLILQSNGYSLNLIRKRQKRCWPSGKRKR